MRSSRASVVANEQLIAEVRRHELGLMGIAVRLAIFVGLAGALWAVIEVWLPPKSLWVSASKWTVGVVVGLIVIFSVGRRFAGWNSLTKEFELDTDCEKLVGTSLY